MTINVLVKSAAKPNARVVPRAFELENPPNTAGDLIDEAVRTCVREFEAGRGLFSCLTGREIEEASQSGKISFEGHDGAAVVLDEATANARQCFEDGMVRIVVDDVPLRTLNQRIDISEDSTAVFIRLSMLAGRWF